MNIREQFGDGLKLEEPLAKYTAARLGGPAEMLYVAYSRDELQNVMMVAWNEDIPVRVLGGGANVLVSDAGVRGLVVINDVSGIDFQDDNTVVTWSGTSLTTLARKTAARGLSGFEWAVSVPGTVGGAVVNNAGAHGSAIAANLKRLTARYHHTGPIPQPSQLQMGFGYRTSTFKERIDKRFIILTATFALTPDDPAAIQVRIDANIAHRKRTQPPGASLGSIFKNPPGDYAGRLIESAGLKGYAIGGAQVSPIHANFFINTGGATASDYLALIYHVRDNVARHSGIDLEMEIETLGTSF